MTFRRVLVAATGMALVATPALPQSLPATSVGNRAATSVNYSVAPSLRAALRMMGLDRQGNGTTFTRKSLTNDTAVFENVRVAKPNSEVVTIASMTIKRDMTVGPTMGQMSIEASGFGVGTDFRATNVSMRQVAGDKDPLTRLGQFFVGPANQTAANGNLLIGAMVMNGVTLTSGEGDKAESMSLGEMSFSDVVLGAQTRTFSGLNIKNLRQETKEATLAIVGVNLTGLRGNFMNVVKFTGNGGTSLPKLDGLELAGAQFDNIMLTFKSSARSPSPVRTMALGNFSIGGVKPGKIEQFGMTNLRISGGLGTNVWDASLGRFNLSGINTTYVGAIGDIYKSAFASFARSTNAGVDTNVSAPPVASSTANLKLKDILTGGPLDGGVAVIDIGDFKVRGGGLQFDLDRVGFTQERNSAGIITKANFLPGEMRLMVDVAANTGTPNPISGMIASLASNGFVLKYSGFATFAPETDTFKFEQYKMELVDWARVDLGFTMTGFNTFMAETTMADIAKFTADTSKPDATKPTQQLQTLMNFYRGINFINARMEVRDLGGVEKLLPIMARGTPLTTRAQIVAAREGLGTTLRTTAGNKNKPAIERMFSIAAARFLETGQTIVVEANPPAPIPLTSIQAMPANPVAQFGLRVSNQARD